MSILTNFLKLVKPEKNDYVDVEEHISNNLDKIDEKMENFNLNKLDKGGYTGTAQNLLTEISKIASKTVLGRMIVGKGLTVDSSGRTSVVSRNDAIIVNDNDIQLNVYDGVDSTSTTRAGSARAIKMAYDKGVEGLNKADTKLDAGSVSTEYNTAKKIEDKIEEKFDKSGGVITGAVDINSILSLNGGGVEIFGNMPYIDFHQAGDESVDYTVRLICGGDSMSFYSKNNTNNFNFNWVYHRENLNPALGLATGDNGLQYIQTPGTKNKGQSYIDIDTKKIYTCRYDNTTDTTVTSRFRPADNGYIAQKIDQMFTQFAPRWAMTGANAFKFYNDNNYEAVLLYISFSASGPSSLSGSYYTTLTVPVVMNMSPANDFVIGRLLELNNIARPVNILVKGTTQEIIFSCPTGALDSFNVTSVVGIILR